MNELQVSVESKYGLLYRISLDLYEAKGSEAGLFGLLPREARHDLPDEHVRIGDMRDAGIRVVQTSYVEWDWLRVRIAAMYTALCFMASGGSTDRSVVEHVASDERVLGAVMPLVCIIEGLGPMDDVGGLVAVVARPDADELRDDHVALIFGRKEA